MSAKRRYRKPRYSNRYYRVSETIGLFADAEYGVPPKSSQFPAYRLPLETTVRDKESPEGRVYDEINASGKTGELYTLLLSDPTLISFAK